MLQESIDAFKATVKADDWWKCRARSITRFAAYFEDMRGKSARAYDMLTSFHVWSLLSAETRDMVEAQAVPNATITIVGDRWLTYSKNTDTYSVKAGFETHLDTLMARVASEGLSGPKATEAMEAIEHEVALASVANDPEGQERASKAKSKADKAKRRDEIDKAVGRFGKTLADLDVAEPELLSWLRYKGLVEGPVDTIDPATITPMEAGAFAKRMVDLERSAEIHVMLRAFQAYALSDPSRSAPSARPSVNDAPGAPAKPATVRFPKKRKRA